MVLEKELETFLVRLPELRREHEGRFAFIHGEDLIDVFSSYEDAINAGSRRFQLEPFLVKQIHELVLAQTSTRLVGSIIPGNRF